MDSLTIPVVANPNVVKTQVQVADAIAHVREAMLLAEEQEMSHFLQAGKPCEAVHNATDAAVRNALLQSEDAMIQVLQSLPGAAVEDNGPLVN